MAVAPAPLSRDDASVRTAPAPNSAVLTQSCGRCGGTGEELWAGKYRSFAGPVFGPCLRCRPIAFMEAIGLHREAVAEAARLRRKGLSVA